MGSSNLKIIKQASGHYHENTIRKHETRNTKTTESNLTRSQNAPTTPSRYFVCLVHICLLLSLLVMGSFNLKIIKQASGHYHENTIRKHETRNTKTTESNLTFPECSYNTKKKVKVDNRRGKQNIISFQRLR